MLRVLLPVEALVTSARFVDRPQTVMVSRWMLSTQEKRFICVVRGVRKHTTKTLTNIQRRKHQSRVIGRHLHKGNSQARAIIEMS